MRPMHARNLFLGDRCSMRHCAILLHGDVPLPNFPIIHTWSLVMKDARISRHDFSSNVVAFMFFTMLFAMSRATGSHIVYVVPSVGSKNDIVTVCCII